jgi:hypothetical protein
MKLFRNKFKDQVAIYAFVVAFLVLLAVHPRSCAASELSVEGGAAMLRGMTPTLGLDIRWPGAGPVGTDYELGFNLIGDSQWDGQYSPNALTLHGMLWDGYGPLEMGLGFAYTTVPQVYHCQTTFALGARWRLTDRLALSWRHFSSGGSCDPNTGRDLAVVSWKF